MFTFVSAFSHQNVLSENRFLCFRALKNENIITDGIHLQSELERFLNKKLETLLQEKLMNSGLEEDQMNSIMTYLKSKKSLFLNEQNKIIDKGTGEEFVFENLLEQNRPEQKQELEVIKNSLENNETIANFSVALKFLQTQNSKITDDKKRKKIAEAYLQRSLSEVESKVLAHVHKNILNNTQKEKLEKRNYLVQKGGFTKQEAMILLRSHLAGKLPKSIDSFKIDLEKIVDLNSVLKGIETLIRKGEYKDLYKNISRLMKYAFMENIINTTNAQDFLDTFVKETLAVAESIVRRIKETKGLKKAQNLSGLAFDLNKLIQYLLVDYFGASVPSTIMGDSDMILFQERLAQLAHNSKSIDSLLKHFAVHEEKTGFRTAPLNKVTKQKSQISSFKGLHEKRLHLITYSKKNIQDIVNNNLPIKINETDGFLRICKPSSKDLLLSIVINTTNNPKDLYDIIYSDSKEERVSHVSSVGVIPNKIISGGAGVLHLDTFGHLVGFAGVPFVHTLSKLDGVQSNALLEEIYTALIKHLEVTGCEKNEKKSLITEIEKQRILLEDQQVKFRKEEHVKNMSDEEREEFYKQEEVEKKRKVIELHNRKKAEQVQKIADKKLERERERERHNKYLEWQAKYKLTEHKNEPSEVRRETKKDKANREKIEQKKVYMLEYMKNGLTEKDAEEKYNYVSKLLNKMSKEEAEVKYSYLQILKESAGSMKKAEPIYREIQKILKETPTLEKKEYFIYINHLLELGLFTNEIQNRYNMFSSLVAGGTPVYNAEIIVDLSFSNNSKNEEMVDENKNQFELLADSKYRHSLKKIQKKKNTNLNNKISIALEKLMIDPKNITLSSHEVNSSSVGIKCWASTVDKDCRILWNYSDDKKIILLDIGNHNQLYYS